MRQPPGYVFEFLRWALLAHGHESKALARPGKQVVLLILTQGV